MEGHCCGVSPRSAEESGSEEYGGTYLLGVRGLVVICHGNSTRRAVANALRFGADALRKGVLNAVDEEFAKIIPSRESAGS